MRVSPIGDDEPTIACASGGLLTFLRPEISQIHLVDIATGLANKCRYAGQIPEMLYLAVAEHSCAMTEYAVDHGIATCLEDALAVLLHDAAEAYLGDIPTPLKKLLPDFARIENGLQSCILSAMGLDPDAPRSGVGIPASRIKELDRRIRLDEIRMTMKDPAKTHEFARIMGLDPGTRPLDVGIACLQPKEAFDRFVDTFLYVCELRPRNALCLDALQPFIEEARELRETERGLCPA